jgi:hypothetical protein
MSGLSLYRRENQVVQINQVIRRRHVSRVIFDVGREVIKFCDEH